MANKENIYCYWPPKKEEATRSVKQNILPSNHWSQYKCEIIRKLGTVSTYLLCFFFLIN